MYIGEIRPFAMFTLPAGWLPCDGRLMDIGANPLLYQSIGNRFGYGVQFRLPDLQGRVPVHSATSPYNPISNIGGSETVTIPPGVIPVHTHVMGCTASAQNSSNPAGNSFGDGSGGNTPYHVASINPTPVLAKTSVASAGGDQAHPNMQPWLAVLWAICVDGGVLPS